MAHERRVARSTSTPDLGKALETAANVQENIANVVGQRVAQAIAIKGPEGLKLMRETEPLAQVSQQIGEAARKIYQRAVVAKT